MLGAAAGVDDLADRRLLRHADFRIGRDRSTVDPLGGSGRAQCGGRRPRLVRPRSPGHGRPVRHQAARGADGGAGGPAPVHPVGVPSSEGRTAEPCCPVDERDRAARSEVSPGPALRVLVGARLTFRRSSYFLHGKPRRSSAPPTSPTHSWPRWWPTCSHQDDVELLDVARRPGRLRPARHHHRRPLVGERPRGDARARGRRSGSSSSRCSRGSGRPFFQFVPEEFREMAVAGVPWRTEAEVYRSDLADRLPDGLTAPRALGVFDLDATSSSIWLEEVPARAATWDLDAVRAGGVPARPALRPARALAPLASLRDVEWSPRTPTRPAGWRCRWCRC